MEKKAKNQCMGKRGDLRAGLAFIAPLILLFIVAQKFIVKGFQMGARDEVDTGSGFDWSSLYGGDGRIASGGAV